MITAGDYELVYDPSVGESEPWYINDHTFVRDESGTWHLIGITHAEPMAPLDEKHLAHATAPSLHGPWTKQPYAMSADPEAGETQLWAPHVIHHDDRYWMFVCAGGPSMERYGIHLATSTDLRTWERHPANPLLVDGFQARDPMVLRVGDGWLMYYTATATPSGGAHVVKAVRSDDLVHWTDERIVYTDRLHGTTGGPTESPFVVERDGTYHLFIGYDHEALVAGLAVGDVDAVDAAYRRTRVIASDDPLSFSIDDQVGTIASHAAEVVRDEHGDWFVSHCGWSQGGVHLAPLHWE